MLYDCIGLRWLHWFASVVLLCIRCMVLPWSVHLFACCCVGLHWFTVVAAVAFILMCLHRCALSAHWCRLYKRQLDVILLPPPCPQRTQDYSTILVIVQFRGHPALAQRNLQQQHGGTLAKSRYIYIYIGF